MKGGDFLGMPPGYVQKQFKANHLHLDGRVENKDVLEAVGVKNILAECDGWTEAKSVLSLGCRTGAELMVVADPPVRRVGIDIVQEFIDYGKKRRPFLDLRLGNIHKLDLADQEFDLTLCLGTLEHCYNLTAAAHEMQRVTRKNLIVTADLAGDKWGLSDYAASRWPSEWISLFESPEWDLIKAWNLGIGLRGYGALGMHWGRRT